MRSILLVFVLSIGVYSFIQYGSSRARESRTAAVQHMPHGAAHFIAYWRAYRDGDILLASTADSRAHRTADRPAVSLQFVDAVDAIPGDCYFRVRGASIATAIEIVDDPLVLIKPCNGKDFATFYTANQSIAIRARVGRDSKGAYLQMDKIDGIGDVAMQGVPRSRVVSAYHASAAYVTSGRQQPDLPYPGTVTSVPQISRR